MRWQRAAGISTMKTNMPALLVVAFGLLLVSEAWLPQYAIVTGDALGFFPPLYRTPWDGGWDPRLMLGHPSLASAPAGQYYPPAWLLAVDYWAAVGPYIAVHLALAGLGMWAWRSASRPGRGAVLAGIWYAGIGPAWSMSTKLQALPAYALMPWALYGITGLLSGQRSHCGWFIAAGAIACVWLSGGSDLLIVVALSGAGWALLFPLAGPMRPWARLAWTAGLGTVGGLLAGVSLVPFGWYLGVSDRAGGIDADLAARMALQPIDWLGFVVPRRSLVPTSDQPWFDSLYLTVIGLALAGWGFRHANRAVRLACGVMTVGAIIAALGNATPLFDLMMLVPGLSSMRYPEKWLVMGLPFLGWLIAEGADALPRRAPLIGVALACELFIGTRLSEPPIEPVARKASRPQAIDAIDSAWPWGPAHGGWERPRFWEFSEHAGGKPLVANREIDRLGPNTGLLHGVHYAFGRAAMRLGRTDTFFTHLGRAEPLAQLALLRRAGVDLHSADEEWGPLLASQGMDALEPWLWADPEAWPAAVWMEGVDLVPRGRDALAAMERRAARAQVLEAEWPAGVPIPEGIRTLHVLADRIRDDHYLVRDLPGREGVVRLDQAWAEGWQVRVDGGAWRAAFPVDFAFVGTNVPDGAREVAFRYRTPHSDAGFVMSALGLLLLVSVPRVRAFPRASGGQGVSQPSTGEPSPSRSASTTNG